MKCACGCGRDAGAYTRSRPARGFVRGAPRRYIPAHASRSRRVAFDDSYIVDERTGCWLWQRYVGNNGYGEVLVDGKKRLAHAVSFERAGGVVPPGFVLHHRCNTKICVNPFHLKPLSRRDHRIRHQAAELLGAAAL